MENQVIIVTSPSSLEVGSNGNKRKEYSSPPSSASYSSQLSRPKRQKTSENMDGVNVKNETSTVYGSSSESPILILESDIGFVNLKNGPSRVYGTTPDKPILIKDYDDIDSINGHHKDAILTEPAQAIDLTGMDCMETKASKQAKKSADFPVIVLDLDDIDVNSTETETKHTLIETADERLETALTRSDPDEVELSEQGSKSSFEGKVDNNLQFYLIKVGGPKDVPGLKSCNIQTDLSVNYVDNSLTKIDSENDNPSSKALMDEGTAIAGNDMITKNEDQQIDVKANSLDASDDDSDDRVCQKFKELRELDSPSNCNIAVEETMCSDTEDTYQDNVEDDLSEMWKQMALALECSKDYLVDPAATGECVEEHRDECDHDLILKDDLGYVCRVCGVIQRSIDSIIEFQFSKGKRSTRTQEPRETNNINPTNANPNLISSHDLALTEISAHPTHRKLMKPHQVEGFKFLCSNLITDNPGGCILAHAPGSGKTFMIISFIQSFLAQYPDARPLVVLPKGILQTWKNEFLKWQVGEIPLHDFYTSKAENRSQQLCVLNKWVKEKSILFLSYKQLSVIVCDSSGSQVADKCKDILLKFPTIIILDEGHTPRNEETDVLQAISRVETSRKVVLSGTLYQNHVKEVFNILNLVRPNFLKRADSKMIVNRVMSRVKISRSGKHNLKSGSKLAFYDSVEYTLHKDEDLKRRKAVIEDLREMTRNILHYYKGDFLDELPGLVDYTVVLNLSPTQKNEVQMLRKLDNFKRASLGSAIYIHPVLKSFSQASSATLDGMVDEVLEGLNVNEGVKAKFFLSMLGLCESAREKLLVFSQYITPLKFLERLTAKVKSWKTGREVFMITGDTNVEERERTMELFNGSEKARVFFGSIKACGEGISLVGASRILILDVHLNPSVTRQAIGRAFRPGQTKKVFAYRLIAGDSPEEEDCQTCSRKELVSKMWFEWNGYCGKQDFDMKTVDFNECDDVFFQSSGLAKDLNVLYKR